MITVAKDGSGDYTSVQEAIDSITSVPETVFIKNGIYKERVEIHKDNITLIGENADGTVITNNYYAFMPMEDGSKRGTFRSYTFFVQANHFNAYNITFENSAGFGKKVGQAIAVYAEGDDLVLKLSYARTSGYALYRSASDERKTTGWICRSDRICTAHSRTSVI